MSGPPQYPPVPPLRTVADIAQVIQELRDKLDKLEQVEVVIQQTLSPMPHAPNYQAEITLIHLRQMEMLLSKAIQEMGISAVTKDHLSRKRVADIIGVHQMTVGRWVKEELNRPRRVWEKQAAHEAAQRAQDAARKDR